MIITGTGLHSFLLPGQKAQRVQATMYFVRPHHDFIYAIWAVMIIPRNNVHLFQQQSDKLNLCCTFGLLAWTLLSNVSQLGLLLKHKNSFQTASVSWMSFCLDPLQKGIFSLSTLPLSSPSPLPPQAVGRRKSRTLSYICCVPSVSTESEALPGLAQEAAFHRRLREAAFWTLARHLRKPTATYTPSGSSDGCDQPSRNVTSPKSLWLQTSSYRSHTTAPIAPQDACVLWTAGNVNIIYAILVFQRKKGIDTDPHFKYTYTRVCMHTHITPFATNKKTGCLKAL